MKFPLLLAILGGCAVFLTTPVLAGESPATPPAVAGHVNIPVPKEPLEGTVVQRTSVHAEDGRTITMQMIEPPDLPAAPVPDPAISRAAALAFEASHADETPRFPLGITATVYDHQKTYLEWTMGEERFGAWSNVDFNYLTQVGEVTTGENGFMLFVFPVNANTAALSALAQRHGEVYRPPNIPAFASGTPSFLVVKGDAANAAALAPINALHQLYRKQSESLKAAYQQRLADGAAQAAYNQAHPKQPTNTVVQFWKRDVPASTNTPQEGTR